MPIPTSEETEYTRHEARGKLFKLVDGRYAELCAGTLKIMANKQDKTAGRLGEMLSCRGVLQLADYSTCTTFLHLPLPLLAPASPITLPRMSSSSRGRDVHHYDGNPC